MVMKDEGFTALTELVEGAINPYTIKTYKTTIDKVIVGDAIKIYPSGISIATDWATVIKIEPGVSMTLEHSSGREVIPWPEDKARPYIVIQNKAHTFPR